MALHNDLKLFFILHSLLIPLNLAQPEVSPSPAPESSPHSESVSSPSLAPASIPAPTVGPNPGQSPSIAQPPSSEPMPSLFPSSGPAAAPGPSSGPAPGPALGSSQSLPALGLSPSSEPTPVRSPGPSSDGSTESDVPSQLDFAPTLSPSIDIDPKVKQICDNTDYPALCLTTVAPFLNGKANVASVLDVSLKAGAKLSRHGLFLAQRLTVEPGISPAIASVINDCMGSYNTAVENYENAIDALPEDDMGTIKIKLSAVITYVGDCDDALSKKAPDSQLSSISTKLRNMTSNCLAIASL